MSETRTTAITRDSAPGMDIAECMKQLKLEGCNSGTVQGLNKLLLDNHEQINSLKDLLSTVLKADGQQKHVDYDMMSISSGVCLSNSSGLGGEEYIQVTCENQDLRAQVEHLTEDQAAHKQSINRLTTFVQEINRSKEQFEQENKQFRAHILDLEASLQKEKDEKSVLQVQIQTCTEDFRLEQQEKDALKRQLKDLRLDYDLTKRQLEQFQMDFMAQARQRREAAFSNYRNEFYARQQQQHQFTARGAIQCDGVDEDETFEGGDDVIDAPMVNSARRTSPPPSDTDSLFGSRDRSSNMLECPRCKKGYPAEEHTDFLEHIDQCCV